MLRHSHRYSLAGSCTLQGLQSPQQVEATLSLFAQDVSVHNFLLVSQVRGVPVFVLPGCLYPAIVRRDPVSILPDPLPGGCGD